MMLVVFLVFLYIACTDAIPSVIPNLIHEVDWNRCTYTRDNFTDHLCPPGRIVNPINSECSRRKRCCLCAKGYMDRWNNCNQCKPHRNCLSEGKEFISRGNKTHDVVCGDDIITTTVEPFTTVQHLIEEGTISPSGTIGTTKDPPDDCNNISGKHVIHPNGLIATIFVLLSALFAAVIYIVMQYRKLKRVEAENMSLRQLWKLPDVEDQMKMSDSKIIGQGISSDTISTL